MLCFVFVGLPCQTRVISGVPGELVGVIGLYSQPVLNGSTIDKGTTQKHREIVERKRERLHGTQKRLRGSIDSPRRISGLPKKDHKLYSRQFANVEFSSSSQSCSLRLSGFALTNICFAMAFLGTYQIYFVECGPIAIRIAKLRLTGRLQTGRCQKRCVDETIITRVTHIFSSRIVDTGLTVVVRPKSRPENDYVKFPFY
jgi:hypothetical protein